MNRFLFCWLLTLAWGGIAAADPLAHQIDVRPNKVQLGQTFEFEVLISHPLNERYDVRTKEWPKAFELVDVQRERKDLTASSQTRFIFKLAAFELGNNELPPITFDVARPQGPSEWTSPGTHIECVASLDEKTNEFADIKPPEEVLVPSWRSIYWALGTLGVAALAFWLFRWWKKRSKQKTPSAPRLAPHEEALLELQSLRRQKLPERGQVREFHFRWAEILRQYLGQRFALDAMECTSFELLAALEQQQELSPWREDIRLFLEQADIARYAKAPVSMDACERAADFAETLIRQTSSFLSQTKP